MWKRTRRRGCSFDLTSISTTIDRLDLPRFFVLQQQHHVISLEQYPPHHSRQMWRTRSPTNAWQSVSWSFRHAHRHTYFWSAFIKNDFSISNFTKLLQEVNEWIFHWNYSILFTSNMALRSSSRNRKGIFETCKRFWIVPDVVLACVDDVPLVLVDCGEWDDEEFDWA